MAESIYVPVKMIVVMGPTGAGKSSFIRNAVPSNFQSDIQIGHGLESETSKIRPISYRMSDGTHINIVDTPGFDDSHEGINDVQVLEMIATFLADGYKKRTYDLVGILYFHRISDTRVGGTTKRNLRMFQKICGTKALENVVIVTTMWDKVTAEEGSAREEELLKSEDLFKPLIDGKAVLKRYNAIRQPKTAVEIVDDFRNKNVVTTQIVHELVHQKKALADTEAGAELQKEVQALLEKRMKEIQELEAEIQRAVEEKDKKTVEMVLTEKQAVQEDITKLHGQLKRLVCGKVAFQSLKTTMEKIVKGIEMIKTRLSRARTVEGDQPPPLPSKAGLPGYNLQGVSSQVQLRGRDTPRRTSSIPPGSF